MVRQILYLTALAAISLHGQPAGTGVISGVVLDHATGTPIRKAIVNVRWQGTPESWATQQTDGSGRFTVDSLPAGSFTISAMKEGAGIGSWGDNPAVTGQLLKLAAGERRADVVVRLVRSITISGVVTDMDGEPLVGADVQLAQEAWPRGTKELMPVGGARTNDRGEYRILSNRPGRFYLSAQAQDRQMMGNPAVPPLGFVRQFHGGGTNWQKATPLVLQSGQQLKGIDFRLEGQRMVSVRGRITNPPPMPEPPGPNQQMRSMPPVMIQVTSDEGRQSRHSYGGGMNQMDGTFHIPAVPPGPVILSAWLQGEKPLWATLKLDLKTDMENVALTLAPAAALKGKLTVEGESPTPMAQMMVELTSPTGRPMGPGGVRATPAPDGTFTFDQVPPGVWDINVRPIPKGGFIKSMRLGQQDVLTEEMEIGSNAPAALQLVVSSRGGTVVGQVTQEEGMQSRGMVVLAPQEKFQHVSSFYAFAPTREEGRFELTGLTPGKYRLYALESTMTPFDWRNPEILRKLTEESIPLEIAEGARLQASPKLVRAARVQEVMQQ